MLIENKILSGIRVSGKINNNLKLGFLNMITDEDFNRLESLLKEFTYE